MSLRQRVLLACGWTLFALSAACLVLGLPPMCGVPLSFVSPRLGSSLHLAILTGAIVGLPLSFSLIYTASLQPDRRRLERNCRHCGYDLRGNLSTSICPECGGSV